MNPLFCFSYVNQGNCTQISTVKSSNSKNSTSTKRRKVSETDKNIAWKAWVTKTYIFPIIGANRGTEIKGCIQKENTDPGYWFEMLCVSDKRKKETLTMKVWNSVYIRQEKGKSLDS